MAEQQETSQDERTENPSAYRREEFRKQGRVAFSRELVSVAVLGAGLVSVLATESSVVGQWEALCHHFFHFGNLSSYSESDLLDQGRMAIHSFLGMLTPIFVACVLAGLVAASVQAGFYLSWEVLRWDPSRINPISGLGRLWSKRSLVEVAKAFFKIGFASGVLYLFVRWQRRLFFIPVGSDLHGCLFQIVRGLGKLSGTFVLSLGALAGLDYLFQRSEFEKSLRMTRREAKEEFKLREGDPLLKARVRGVQRRLMRRRMMDAVAEADVVVTNPTHLAVALKYDAQAMPAPKVVAKGAGVIAEKIRSRARQANVPLVENKPLARTLYKEIEINNYIPRELYKAVAEVLAYVYRLRNRLPAVARSMA